MRKLANIFWPLYLILLLFNKKEREWFKLEYRITLVEYQDKMRILKMLQKKVDNFMAAFNRYQNSLPTE